MRPMAMTRDHGGESSGLWIEIEFRQVVEHVEMERSDREYFPQRQRRRPRAAVDIASNRQRGRDGTELFEYLEFAHVAGMNDEI